MDNKKSLIGLLLIMVIVVITFYFNQPKNIEPPIPAETKKTTEAAATPAAAVPDSLKQTDSSVTSLAGVWGGFSKGTEQELTLENEKMEVHISTLGGRVSYIRLKEYKTFDGKPLILTDKASSKFEYSFISAENQTINTGLLYFTPSAAPAPAKGSATSTVTMSLVSPQGTIMQQKYSLKGNSYLLDYDLNMKGMEKVLPNRTNRIDLRWQADILRHEKDMKISQSHSTVHYRKHEENSDNLAESKDAEEDIKLKTDWVSFKEQFFAQTLINKQGFERGALSAKVPTEPTDRKLTSLGANLTLAYNHRPDENYAMQFYFGPLHYNTLKKMDMDLERQIPLGWGFFLISWVNRFIIIPVFNFLSQFIGNYGIIILLLTIFIKLIILPLTYKSYLSTAKMRILKPELDELKAKYGDDMTKQQQEQMKMYRRAGVSPFGGCLPLLLQFPILVAMFRFFPSSIELRQESFLWATDLSTYDSIYNFGHVPDFINSIYGDHISLFTLLMTASTILYTHMNSSLNPQQNEFKWMSYLMPIFFLGFFNKYSAGLSLYYFLFNMLTFGQQYLFKLAIDDKKLMAQIEENKKKPQNQKKSKFQQKLEDMAKQQQAQKQQGKKPQPPTRRK